MFNEISKGPSFIQTFEEGVSTPVIGSRTELNDPTVGSPFTIRLLLPSVLQTSFTGGGVSVPKGIFDPFLEELNDEDFRVGQSLVGTREPTSVNIGLVESATKAFSNWGSVLTKREKFRKSSFVSNSQGLQNLRDMIYGNGLRTSEADLSKTSANQNANSDLLQALSVILQANYILNSPVLQMFINPSSLTITYGKKMDYSQRVRNGYVVQAWGEEQPKLSVEGKIGSFIASSPEGGSNGETVSVSGYQWNSRLDSASFRNLMDLFKLYKNNAMIYDVLGRSEAHLWTGDVAISFDQKVYLGNFENFNYSYDETSQTGGISYSFEFEVSKEYDTHQYGSLLQVNGTEGVNGESASVTSLGTPESSSQEVLLNPLFG